MKDPFEYQQPSTVQVEMIERVRKSCRELNALLLEIPVGLDNSGYVNNSIMRLEEASMWANRAISFGPYRQVRGQMSMFGESNIDKHPTPSGVEGTISVEQDDSGGCEWSPG